MELWTTTHAKTLLPAVTIMLILCIVLRKMLIKRELKYRMIPLQIVGVLLLALEVGKQVVSFSRGYDLYHIPFHFCSTLLIAIPAMAFYKGKYADRVRAVGTALTGATCWLTLIYPVLIYSSGNIDNFFVTYLDFHTVAFHNLAIFAYFLILALELHTPMPKGEAKTVIVTLTVFCLIASVASQLLQTNYGGFFSCNVAPVEDIRLSLQTTIGYWPAQLIYIVGLTAVHYGFVLGFYQFYKPLHRLLAKQKNIVSV